MRNFFAWRYLVAAVLVSLYGCALPPSGGDSDLATASLTPERQYMCVSKVYLSDATLGYQLSSGNDIAPLGEWLGQQIAARFWVDSSRKASGVPLPTVAVGLANGTGARPAGIGKVEAQVVLQFQMMKPTGKSYSDGAAGKATANNLQQATRDALEQSLRGLENVLSGSGFCRRME